MSSLTAEDVAAELKKPLDPSVRRALEIRRDGGRSSVAKYKTLLSMSEVDGRVRGSHLYYGAHTGRWAGRGVQFQNVPRGRIGHEHHETLIALLKTDDYEAIELAYGDMSEVLVSCLRPMVCATEGHELVVVDFSGIEARVLAWVAGQKDLIQLFIDGGDPYKAMASKIYNVRVDEVTKDQRLIGKIAQLGLGYGMGPVRFLDMCSAYGVRGIDAEFAQRVVDIYRSANANIRQLWYSLERAAKAAVQSPQELFISGRGRMSLSAEGRVLTILLPSGRSLWYRAPVTDDGRLSYERTSSLRVETYGGKLTENIVQAIARDLLAEAMLRLHADGHQIVMHVHDEVVIEAPIGKTTPEEIGDVMCELPDWASGLPLNADGYHARRFRK